MRITIYNPDGSIKEEREYNVQIPHYIYSFDNEHSFLNITDIENEVIGTDERSLRKSLTEKNVFTAIRHDFDNYVEWHSVKVTQEEILDLYMQSETDSNIIMGDQIVSSILRIYGKKKKYVKTELSANDITVINELFTQIESYIYINKVESTSGEYSCSLWIRVLLCHAARSVKKSRRRRYNWTDNEEEFFFVSLQNLINNYYYALSHIQKTYQTLPNELEIQKKILSLFVSPSDLHKSTRYYNSKEFLCKITNVLYDTNEKNRKDIYFLAQYIFVSNPLIQHGTNALMMLEDDGLIKCRVVEKHEIDLYDHHNKKCGTFEIDDNEIDLLRTSDDSFKLYNEIKVLLEDTYAKHVLFFEEKWRNSVETDADGYFHSHNSNIRNWSDYYYYEIGRIRGESRMHSNCYNPQQCFFYLVCDHCRPNEELTFNRSIIANLLLLLSMNKSNSQEGLYECMFKINYIKKKINPLTLSDFAVTKAMEYIQCLFVRGCEHIMPMYQEDLEPIMKDFLNNKNVRTKITMVKPNGFTLGFNLKLVYNLLGLLKGYGIVISGSEKLDKYINEYNHKRGLIEYTSEKKSHITNYNKKGKSEILDFIDDLKSILSKYSKK